MSKFDAQAIEEIVTLTREMLVDAGFTGVKIEASPMPNATIEALEAQSAAEGDDEIPFRDPEFAKEIHYHRVTSDQGAFGIWFEPYVTVDLHGLDLDIKAFLPPEAAADVPEGWCLIGMDDGVPERLFIELVKKRREP
jgi:hypothetical protein